MNHDGTAAEAEAIGSLEQQQQYRAEEEDNDHDGRDYQKKNEPQQEANAPRSSSSRVAAVTTTATATTSSSPTAMMSDLLLALQQTDTISSCGQTSTAAAAATTTGTSAVVEPPPRHRPPLPPPGNNSNNNSDEDNNNLLQFLSSPPPSSGGSYSILSTTNDDEIRVMASEADDDDEHDDDSENNKRQRAVSEPEMRAFLLHQVQQQSQSATTTASATLRQRRRPSNNNNNDQQQQQQRGRSFTTEGTTTTARVVVDGSSGDPMLARTTLHRHHHHPETTTTTQQPDFLSPLSPPSSTAAAERQQPQQPPTLVVAMMDGRLASSSLSSGSSPRRLLQPTTTSTTTTTTPAVVPEVTEDGSSNSNSNSMIDNNEATTTPPLPQLSTSDGETLARIRWIRINRRFQLVITVVALLFSFLLFSILICWVVLTSAYVVSFDKPCDIPLKPYFWLVTLQLVLDVFRSDIMRFVFQWDSRSNQRIPARVIAYNIAYLIYALMVLRMGIRSLYGGDGGKATCRSTAPDLFNASVAFVSLSIAAWTTIICGYLLPFCVVAALLTWNGYSPSNSSNSLTVPIATQAVFPAAYSSSGAPPGCIEQLPVLSIEEFPRSYPNECCICMEEFVRQDVVVETKCRHVFHKSCCREWLRQARTCPVCRDDIPSTLDRPPLDESSNRASSSGPASIPIGPSGRPVAGLWRMLRTAASSVGGESIRGSPSPRSTMDDDNSGTVLVEQPALIEMESARAQPGIRDV